MDASSENRTRIRLLARSPKASELLTLDDLLVLTTYDIGETRRTMYRAELVLLFERVDAVRALIRERWGHPGRSGGSRRSALSQVTSTAHERRQDAVVLTRSCLGFRCTTRPTFASRA
jgi:hypothetical protein